MESSTKNKAASYLPRTLIACGVLLILAALLFQYLVVRAGHDQASSLFEAHRMLAGAEVYGPQLSETNPPVIIWFSAIPVTLSAWLHANPVLTFRLMVMVLAFASVAWCIRIVRRADTLSSPFGVALFGCAVLAIEFSIGPYDFGQRENLLVIFLLPYVLAVAAGAVGRLSMAERIAVGMVAGFAIWFKPHHVLIPVALELFYVIRTRSFRRILAPEVVSLILSSCFILLLVRLLTPLYFTVMLPLLVDTYWGMETTNAVPLALSLHVYMTLVVATIAACAWLRKRLRDPATPVALVMSSVAASVAFDLQRMDWPYHYFPHHALLALAIAYVVADLLRPALDRFTSDLHLRRRVTISAAAVMAVLICVVAVRPRIAFHRPAPPPANEYDRLLAQQKAGTVVYDFSTVVPPMAYSYEYGLIWGSRFAHLWMLPAIVQNELGPIGPRVPFKRLPPERVAALAELLRSQSADDLNYWKPAFVLVPHCTRQLPCRGVEGKDFDTLGWFLQSPKFVAAWSTYQKQPGWVLFDLYKRAE